MSAVAVLLTHMLNNAAAVMNPPTTDAGVGLTHFKIVNATRLCRLEDCIAKAMRNPPRKRNTNGLAVIQYTRRKVGCLELGESANATMFLSSLLTIRGRGFTDGEYVEKGKEDNREHGGDSQWHWLSQPPGTCIIGGTTSS